MRASLFFCACTTGLRLTTATMPITQRKTHRNLATTSLFKRKLHNSHLQQSLINYPALLYLNCITPKSHLTIISSGTNIIQRNDILLWHPASLLQRVDIRRVAAIQSLEVLRRGELGSTGILGRRAFGHNIRARPHGTEECHSIHAGFWLLKYGPDRRQRGDADADYAKRRFNGLHENGVPDAAWQVLDIDKGVGYQTGEFNQGSYWCARKFVSIFVSRNDLPMD